MTSGRAARIHKPFRGVTRDWVPLKLQLVDGQKPKSNHCVVSLITCVSQCVAKSWLGLRFHTTQGFYFSLSCRACRGQRSSLAMPITRSRMPLGAACVHKGMRKRRAHAHMSRVGTRHANASCARHLARRGAVTNRPRERHISLRGRRRGRRRGCGCAPRRAATAAPRCAHACPSAPGACVPAHACARTHAHNKSSCDNVITLCCIQQDAVSLLVLAGSPALRCTCTDMCVTLVWS